MTARKLFSSPAEATANVSSWQDAVDNVVEYLIAEGQCFSSGEVVTHIRMTRPDLTFRHGWVGERIQNAYANDSLPGYDGGPSIGEIRPVQATRQTSGLGRTPAGINVFVYGPDVDEVSSHHFEVDVPLPGGVVRDGQTVQPVTLSPAALAMMGGTAPAAPTTTPVSPAPTTTPGGPPPAVQPVVATGKQVPGDVAAKVHADGRVCIPKLAFEALAFGTGTPVVGGKPLYATWTGLTVEIRHDKGLSIIYPTTDFCRVHLTPPQALPLGKEYAVVFSLGCLTIDFSKPL